MKTKLFLVCLAALSLSACYCHAQDSTGGPPPENPSGAGAPVPPSTLPAPAVTETAPPVTPPAAPAPPPVEATADKPKPAKTPKAAKKPRTEPEPGAALAFSRDAAVEITGELIAALEVETEANPGNVRARNALYHLREALPHLQEA